MKEAMYYKKMDDNLVFCQLCPQNCKIEEGDIGECRVRKNIEGTLYSLNYGQISAYGYDPIEKKPLYHFNPKSIIFSIGSYGCNLSCDFCQNWQIAHRDPRTTETTDEDMIRLAKSRNSIGIAYTYNEPSVWYEYVLHLSKIAKQEGLYNVLVTNGYINPKPLEELLPYIDAMNIDLKSMSEDFYHNFCEGRVKPVLNTIKRAAKSIHVEVTTLIIDGVNSSPEEIETLAKTIAEIGADIPLHLSRYFPAYKMDLPPTKIETATQARDIAKKHLNNVYTGNI